METERRAKLRERNVKSKIQTVACCGAAFLGGTICVVAMAMRLEVLAGLAFLFSVGFLLQILGCALYNNWWPMLTGLMYIMLPMPCLFFGGDSSGFISSEGGDWADAAKFLTGFSSVGSIAIPAILRHANLITAGAMWIEFTAFFVLLATVVIFQRVSQEDDYY